MICPYCSSTQTCVKDSRIVGYTRRRRYLCLACGKRFSTRETVIREPERKDENDG